MYKVKIEVFLLIMSLFIKNQSFFIMQFKERTLTNAWPKGAAPSLYSLFFSKNVVENCNANTKMSYYFSLHFKNMRATIQFSQIQSSSRKNESDN